MKHKLIAVIFCAAGLAFFSCNRTEKKEEAAATTKKDSIPAAQVAANKEMELQEKKYAADTTNYDNRTMLAAAYYNAGAIDKAIYQFTKVVDHDSKNVMALGNLGNIYYDVKQDDKAIEYYERALELDPKNIDMRCDLATCYMNINKLKKAIKLLKENIEINPKHEKSHHNIAVILKQNGDLK